MFLVFVPEHNSRFKKDAEEFQRQANSFMAYHESRHEAKSHIHTVDNSLPTELQERSVIETISSFKGMTKAVVFFCHGFKNRIQFGFKNPSGAQHLAIGVSDSYSGQGTHRSIFYACSLGKDEDNWANWYCDELERQGLEYWSIFHEGSGHTTRNPICEYRGTTGSHCGAARLIRDQSPIWKAWQKKLGTDFAYEYPFLKPSEITTELLGYSINSSIRDKS